MLTFFSKRSTLKFVGIKFSKHGSSSLSLYFGLENNQLVNLFGFTKKLPVLVITEPNMVLETRKHKDSSKSAWLKVFLDVHVVWVFKVLVLSNKSLFLQTSVKVSNNPLLSLIISEVPITLLCFLE